MRTVWIRGQGGVLVRADAIIMLTSDHDTLNAECAGGRTVRLADSDCPGALQLALLKEIRRAGAETGMPSSSCRQPSGTRQPGVASVRTRCWSSWQRTMASYLPRRRQACCSEQGLREMSEFT